MFKSIVFVAFYFGSLVAKPQSKGPMKWGKLWVGCS